MLREVMMSVALIGAALGAAPVACAGEDGALVLGRRTGPDGALLVAPARSGFAGRSGFVFGGPAVFPRPDIRYGQYGRPALGYGGTYYGAIPGPVYEIASPDRMYCPESRAYYPAVQECATPWLRLRAGGGVTADSPIPLPNGPLYGPPYGR